MSAARRPRRFRRCWLRRGRDVTARPCRLGAFIGVAFAVAALLLGGSVDRVSVAHAQEEPPTTEEPTSSTRKLPTTTEATAPPPTDPDPTDPPGPDTTVARIRTTTTRKGQVIISTTTSTTIAAAPVLTDTTLEVTTTVTEPPTTIAQRVIPPAPARRDGNRVAWLVGILGAFAAGDAVYLLARLRRRRRQASPAWSDDGAGYTELPATIRPRAAAAAAAAAAPARTGARTQARQGQEATPATASLPPQAQSGES